MDVFFFYIYDNDTDTTVPVPVDDLHIEDEQELEFIYDDTIRKVWNAVDEEWYFSVYDVIKLLTDSSDPKQYIKKMRSRDSELDVKWGTICTPLKMPAIDGKMRKIQSTNTEGLLRIIQSVPSKKAEPFKQWLAQVGKERLDEIADPELAIERAVQTYRQKGYSEKWIKTRLHGIDSRNKLTAEWDRAGITSSKDYAALTSILTKTWSGKTIREYKQLKELKKESLRDNMTDIELTLNQLAEVSATAIAKVKNPKGFPQTKETVVEGGTIARTARNELEKTLGQSVISSLNAKSPDLLDMSDDK